MKSYTNLKNQQVRASVLLLIDNEKICYRKISVAISLRLSLCLVHRNHRHPRIVAFSLGKMNCGFVEFRQSITPRQPLLILRVILIFALSMADCFLCRVLRVSDQIIEYLENRLLRCNGVLPSCLNIAIIPAGHLSALPLGGESAPGNLHRLCPHLKTLGFVSNALSSFEVRWPITRARCTGRG